MMISLKIVDGNRIWDGILGVENKPHSRRHETNREYFDLLRDSLVNISQDKYDYSFQCSPSSSSASPSSSSDPTHGSGGDGGSILTFIIKERMEGMSALIARYDYLLYSHNSYGALTSLYQSLHALLANKDDHISCLKTEIQSNRSALDALCQQNLEFTKNRESFQREFFTKFCLIVNSKKDEIKRLCGEVGHYKEQMESLKAQLTTLQQQNQHRSSLQNQLRNEEEVQSLSGEVNPKPKPKRAPSKKRVAPRYTKATPSQSSESKSYLSEDEEEEFGDEEQPRENREEVGDSFGDLSSQLRGKGNRVVAPVRRRGQEVLDSTQSSQILPPRGVEVGGDRDLDKILFQSQHSITAVASQTSSSRHSGDATKSAIPPVKNEEIESRRPATRSSSQQHISTQLETVDPPDVPSASASLHSQASKKQKTRVRQMFGSSSEDEAEGQRAERPKKQPRRVAGDDDVLNYM